MSKLASCFSLCFAVISGTLWGMKLKKTKFKTEVRLIVHLDVKADPLLHIHSWLIAVLRMRSNNLYSPSKVIDIKKNSSGQIFDFPSWNLFRLSYTLDYNMLGFLLGFFWFFCLRLLLLFFTNSCADLLKSVFCFLCYSETCLLLNASLRSDKGSHCKFCPSIHNVYRGN